jgi:hypothetical protein
MVLLFKLLFCSVDAMLMKHSTSCTFAYNGFVKWAIIFGIQQNDSRQNDTEQNDIQQNEILFKDTWQNDILPNATLQIVTLQTDSKQNNYIKNDLQPIRK